MNNLIKILALSEDALSRVVFVNARKEAGINQIYNPLSDEFEYQVFIHNRFPYKETDSWTFDSFSQARSFASKQFKDWDILSWDYQTKRPCELEGRECGTGLCETCIKIMKDSGEDFDPNVKNSCGSCGLAGDAFPV